MNFFQAQDSARRSTSVLVLLFGVAVSGLLALSNYIVFIYIYLVEYSELTFSFARLGQVFDAELSIMLSAAILLFICLGSLYKLVQLSSGGSVIAQHLGGVIIPRSSSDPLHKKILNVVEEMAIASGTPVPQVYIINEQGINAFAAGWKTTNAVIGITQGALERLTRDQLQGVIAHEFSHIFNGDMRLNIRLIAVLHGILMIGMLGRMILRSLRYMRSSRNSKGSGQAVLLVLGIGGTLAVIGYTGTFFGNWIKSLVSRQREYLADASAVQFTRSRDGIANALKKIGGAIPGSALLAASVDEYSHAYFAEGDSGMSFFSFSTHPPLKKRILRIDPGWDGKYLFDERKPLRESDTAEQSSAQQAAIDRKSKLTAGIAVAGAGAGIDLEDAVQSLDQVGNVSQQQVEAAKLWHQQLPEAVLANAENPYSAQALILALLLHADARLKKRQLDMLNGVIGELHASNVMRLRTEVSELAKTQSLPLIDLCMPTLREMTVEQYRRFRSCLRQLIAADKKVELREWIIQRVISQHLDEQYALREKSVAKYFVLGSAKYAIELMLSLLAYLEHRDEVQAKAAFDLARDSISAGALHFRAKEEVTVVSLDGAMDELEHLKPPLKKRFLQACVTCISHDGKVSLQAYELTRAIASCLDCPMPPVLVSVDED